MTVKKMNSADMSATTVALLDLLSDGTWYDNKALIAFGAARYISEDPEEAIRKGRTRAFRKAVAKGETIANDILADAGARDHVRNLLMIQSRSGRLDRTKTMHRMTEETCAYWTAHRGTSLTHPVLLTEYQDAALALAETKQAQATAREEAKATKRAQARAEASAQRKQADKPAEEVSTNSTDAVAAITVAGTDVTTPQAPQSIAAPDIDDEAEVIDLATAKTTKKTKKRNPADPVHAGIPESVGFAMAPLTLKSRVHFTLTERGNTISDIIDLVPEFIDALPADIEATFDSESGLYRLDAPHGTGEQVKEFVLGWADANDYRAKGLRIEADLRRRNIKDLDPYFLSDLCEHYMAYSRGSQERQQSFLSFHFSDKDDQRQQFYIWIMEAASRYDETSGVPFGAFFAGRIPGWVKDLGRAKEGRTLADAEMRHQKVVQQYLSTEGRLPTEREHADALGQDVDTFRKNAQVISTMQGMRNAQSINLTGDDQHSDIQIADEAFVEDRYEEALRESLVSRVLTDACQVNAEETKTRGQSADKPNVLGLIAIYESMWGGKNKTELSAALSTSMRYMNEHTERAMIRMADREDVLLHEDTSIYEPAAR